MNMFKIKGIEIPTLGFSPQKIGDLIYQEGPVLAHFVDNENSNNHYFYKWTDCDKNLNRWLVFKVSINNIYNFLYKRINLLSLIQNNPFVYLLDLDDNLICRQILITSTNELPEDYLPSENSFFKDLHYEKYAIELKEKLTKKNTFDIVGNITNEIKKQQVDNKKLLELILSFLFEQGFVTPRKHNTEYITEEIPNFNSKMVNNLMVSYNQNKSTKQVKSISNKLNYGQANN